MPAVSKYHLTTQQILDEQNEIEKARKDLKRFDVLYNRYYEAILIFIHKRIDDKETAYDITAQVFMNAMLKLGSYKFMGMPFSSWLYQIASNEVNLFYRKNKVKRIYRIDKEEMVDMASEKDENETTEIHYKEIITEINNSPKQDIELIQMRFFEKRSFKEIGEILNITENLAKTRSYRILERVKKRLLSNKKGLFYEK